MTRTILLLALATLLAGCVHDLPGSVAGGECKIFERPAYEVRGEKPYDQDWIDSQVEGGVGGCHWARPQPRPATIDAAAAPKRAAPAPARKPSLLSRLHRKLKPTPAVAVRPPAAEESTPAPEPEAEPAALPSPPDPVDQLLDSSGPMVGKYQDRMR